MHLEIFGIEAAQAAKEIPTVEGFL